MTTIKLGCAEVAAKGKDLAQNEMLQSKKAAKGKDLVQNEILCSKICAKNKDLAQIAVKRKDLSQKIYRAF